MKPQKEKQRDPRPRFDEQKLLNGSEAIHYAVVMMRESEKMLASKELTNQLVRNALIESFLLHSRELLEFFHPKETALRDKDTIVAIDYLDEGSQWSPVAKTPELETDHNKLHKYLAHLSYSRQNEIIQWDFARISSHLEQNLTSFLATVDKLKLHPDFQKTIARLEFLKATSAYGTSATPIITMLTEP